MCKYANIIKQTMDNNDPQQALIGLLSQQLASRFDNLEKLMNLKIEHINNNVKTSLGEVHHQLSDIKDDIKEIRESHKEDKKDTDKQIHTYNENMIQALNHSECPNGLDDSLKEIIKDLKAFKTDIRKDIGWLTALRENTWLKYFVIIGIIVVLSLVLKSVYDVNLEPVKKVIEIIK